MPTGNMLFGTFRKTVTYFTLQKAINPCENSSELY